MALAAIGAAYSRPDTCRSRCHGLRWRAFNHDGVPVTDIAVSPDGRTIAYLGAPAGSSPTIWLRSLDRSDPVKLAGTEGTLREFSGPMIRAL